MRPPRPERGVAGSGTLALRHLSPSILRSNSAGAIQRGRAWLLFGSYVGRRNHTSVRSDGNNHLFNESAGAPEEIRTPDPQFVVCSVTVRSHFIQSSSYLRRAIRRAPSPSPG